jgi:hypothetical protein
LFDVASLFLLPSERETLCLSKYLSKDLFSSNFSISGCISLKLFFLSLLFSWDEVCFDYMDEDFDDSKLGELDKFFSFVHLGFMGSICSF